ncbi:hypothetical protein EI041_24925, partial [Escherichia coli]|nr:hypothetical protein [Escherichia coli]
SQYQKMRDTLDRRIAKQKERPPASKTRKSAVKIKSRGLKGRTPRGQFGYRKLLYVKAIF